MSQGRNGPIFIVGAPRSGTTLLRVLLNRHPAIGLCDETYFFYYVHGRRRAFGDLARPEARRLLVERYLATDRIRRLGLDLPRLAETLVAEGTSYERLFAGLLQFYARSEGKQRWGEKTPQHALAAATLCRWYPDALLVHLVRDPRDVVASLRRMPWGSRSPLLNARLWARCTAAAEQCRELPNYLLVRYEDLVEEPTTELRRICTALGEEYREDMLAARAPAAADRWWFARAQQPVTGARRADWRRQLEAVDVAVVEHVTASAMQRFGYEPAGRRLPRTALATAAVRAAGEGMSTRLVGLPHLWYHWFRPTELAAEEYWIDRRARPAAAPADAPTGSAAAA